MNELGEKKQENGVVRFVGTPKGGLEEKELTRWERFLAFITPWAKEGSKVASKAKKLAEENFEADVAKKKREVEKFAAETAEIAENIEIKKQQRVTMVNDELQRIFSDNNLPDLAKKLQLANLLASNPEIEAQLGKIDDIITKLKYVNFTEVEVSVRQDELKEGDEPIDVNLLGEEVDIDEGERKTFLGHGGGDEEDGL